MYKSDDPLNLTKGYYASDSSPQNQHKVRFNEVVYMRDVSQANDGALTYNDKQDIINVISGSYFLGSKIFQC